MLSFNWKAQQIAALSPLWCLLKRYSFTYEALRFDESLKFAYIQHLPACVRVSVCVSVLVCGSDVMDMWPAIRYISCFYSPLKTKSVRENRVNLFESDLERILLMPRNLDDS